MFRGLYSKPSANPPHLFMKSTRCNIQYINTPPLFQGADLAIKFMGQDKASRVVEIVCPRLVEFRKFNNVRSALFHSADIIHISI